MLNPAVKPLSPEPRHTPSLNPLTTPFYPADYESSSASEPETNTSSPKFLEHMNLSPLATSFTPAMTTFSSTLDPTASAFKPGLATDTTSITNSSAMTFIPEAGLTTTEDPLEIDSQSAPTDEMFFAEDGDESRATVNLSSSSTESSTTEPLLADDSDSVLLPEPFVYPDDIERNAQELLIHQDPEIHHINWMGQGIMAKISTPAAVSLTVTSTPAKACIIDGENLRDKTILQEAMLAVDPVVYYGDITKLRNLKGESLRDAAIGATAVYYTPFGQWVNDSYGEDDDRPVKDELDMTRYPEGVTVVNGWVPFGGAPTRQDFWNEAEEAYNSAIAMRKKATNERKLFGAGNTPLRNVLSIDGSAQTVSAKQQLLADASGLISIGAGFCKNIATSPSPHPEGQSDNLFKNANWSDDLDDEDEIPVVIRADSPDDLFKNANWADDLDNEDEIPAVIRAHTSEDFFQNANRPADLDDEDEIAHVIQAPVVEQVFPSLSPVTLSKGILRNGPLASAPTEDTVENAEPVKTLKLVPRFRPVISGTGGVRFKPVLPIPQKLQVQPEPESIVLTPVVPSTGSTVHAIGPGSDAGLEEEDEELYGSGSAGAHSDSSSPDESFKSSSCSSSSSLELSPKLAAADESGALVGRSQEEINEEDEFLYGPVVAATKPDDPLMPKPFSLPFWLKPARSLTPKHPVLPIRPQIEESSPVEMFNLPIRLKPVAACHPDMTTADYIAESEELTGSLRKDLSSEVNKHMETITALKSEEDSANKYDCEECVAGSGSCFSYPSAIVDVLDKFHEGPEEVSDPEAEAVLGLKLRSISYPIADTDVLLAPRSIHGQTKQDLEATEGAEEVENVEEVKQDEEKEADAVEVAEQSEIVEETSNSTPFEQVLAESTTPDSPSGSPCASWQRCPANVSPLSPKKGRGPLKMRSVASDHTDVVMPKFNLVPTSLSAMLTSDAEKFAQKLDEIEEEDEEQAETEALPKLEIHSEQTTEEDEVNTKVEKAISMGHILLERSPFCENLHALLPTLVEDDCGSAPVTPERSLAPSPDNPPVSHTPNAMLRKNVQFSLPHDDEDESSTDELIDGAGIGAIFHGEDEEEMVNDSSTLSGAVLYEVDPVYVHTPSAARSFTFQIDISNSSRSGSSPDETFTAASAGSSTLTTVEGSREGSPSPSVVARSAKRPVLIAEPLSDQDVVVVAEPAPARAAAPEKKPSRPTAIKGSLGKKSTGCFTDAAKVQFTSAQRRKSSWTKVENKLRKPAPLVVSSSEKKKKDVLRRALKKVKNAFVKTVKALA